MLKIGYLRIVVQKIGYLWIVVQKIGYLWIVVQRKLALRETYNTKCRKLHDSQRKSLKFIKKNKKGLTVKKYQNNELGTCISVRK